MSSHKYDYYFNLLAMGEEGVGKQDFLSKFFGGSPIENHLKTIGQDFKRTLINFENKLVKLQIYDEPGGGRFRTFTKTWFKGAHGVVLMYDVTNQNSFKNMRNLIKRCEANADESVRKVLVGLKCDEPGRVVTEEQGKQLAEEYNIGFFESSAKTNKNVSEVFYYLVKEILIEKGVVKDGEGIKLSKRKNKKNQCSK